MLKRHIFKTCVLCNESGRIVVNDDDYEDWVNGKYAQDAFPYLSINDREFLISSVCGTCFDKISGEEEE